MSPLPNNHLPIIYETLSLSTKQLLDNNILLQYSDSSDNTNNVVVKIRTDQKEIFSCTFFTSMFETTVNDAEGIPYFIDLIVEHGDYGTITPSVLNPGDAYDLRIYGVYTIIIYFSLNIETNSGNTHALVFLIVRSISDDISVFSGLTSIIIALFCFAWIGSVFAGDTTRDVPAITIMSH